MTPRQEGDPSSVSWEKGAAERRGELQRRLCPPGTAPGLPGAWSTCGEQGPPAGGAREPGARSTARPHCARLAVRLRVSGSRLSHEPSRPEPGTEPRPTRGRGGAPRSGNELGTAGVVCAPDKGTNKCSTNAETLRPRQPCSGGSTEINQPAWHIWASAPPAVLPRALPAPRRYFSPFLCFLFDIRWKPGRLGTWADSGLSARGSRSAWAQTCLQQGEGRRECWGSVSLPQVRGRALRRDHAE